MDDDDFFKNFRFTEHEIKLFPDSLQENIEPLKTLEPNHPLLDRFQKTLKDYLARQIYRLKEDVGEFEAELKNKKQEHELFGVEAYEVQQVVMRQETESDILLNEITGLTKAREQLEYEVEEVWNVNKDTKSTLTEIERKEIDLRSEIDNQNLLLNQMTKWEQEVESDLLVNQRIYDKTRKDKLELASEKKKQDMYVYKLMSDVWQLEYELETMVMQFRIKEEEREKYAEQLMLANVDLEANEADARCLKHAWQSVVATITHRDKHYNNLMESYKKVEEKLLEVNSEIRAIKKQINVELMQNQTLTIFYERIVLDVKQGTRILNLELVKKNKFEQVIFKNDTMLQGLEADKARLITEKSDAYEELRDLVKEWEELGVEKIKKEEELFKKIAMNVANNRNANNLNKSVKIIKENRRSLRIKMSKMENQLSNLEREVKDLKQENIYITEQLSTLQTTVAVEDKQLEDTLKESEHCLNEQSKKIRILEKLKRRFDKLVEETTLTISPQELKIKNLEGQIYDLRAKNKEMQTFWLREQSIVIDLSEKRQEQLKDLNLLDKQIKILDQKNLKINDDIDHFTGHEARINHNISNFQNKLSAATETLCKKKDNKEFLDEKNIALQFDLYSKLEESELESLRLQADITDIEEDKVNLGKELIEINREVLCWEKKIQLVTEAKKNIEKEQSETGEIGLMRAEIHRMNVRYSQLKKIQEKLIVDLEHCVSRREAIMTVSEARMRVNKAGPQNLRLYLGKKIDDMRNKTQKVINDILRLNLKIEARNDANQKLENQIEEIRKNTSGLTNHYSFTLYNINRKMIEKQLNLDILLFKQRKLKVYSELGRGRQPFTMYKTDEAATQAYIREKEMNSKLRTAFEGLINILPGHLVFLMKQHNSLVLPVTNL